MTAISAQAADLLRAAGIPAGLLEVRVDREEYEVTRDKLADRAEHRAGDVTVTTGRHEDHGRTGLVREDGRFTVLAEETGFVRPWGVAGERE